MRLFPEPCGRGLRRGAENDGPQGPEPEPAFFRSASEATRDWGNVRARARDEDDGAWKREKRNIVIS